MDLPRRLLITDIGSTTTKAMYFELVDGGYILKGHKASPTTVEAPHDDVTIGLLNSANELGKSLGLELTDNGKLAIGMTIDAFFATSSAGGGLQMLVTGISKHITAKTAYKAASIAGGVILDVLATDDGRTAYQKTLDIEGLRPDMVLISGGIDGGDVLNVVKNAFLLKSAGLQPKFMADAKMPVVYAGNVGARRVIEGLLRDDVDLQIVPNLRPSFTEENIGPTRDAIHELFIRNVMARAPGYPKVLEWADGKVLPTPTAVESVLELISRKRSANVLMFDIGGATTDVFSHFEGDYMRTVSANLGMSYSASNVLLEAGVENIARWLWADIPENELRNRILNKCINPTRLPGSDTDLEIEQALAREALRLAFEHHLEYTSKVTQTTLEGLGSHKRSLQKYRGFSEKQYLNIDNIDLVFGSGGVLSMAPERWQAARMLIDAIQPVGITTIAVDSVFMSPHLGLMLGISEDAAYDCFQRECYIPLGTCVGFKGQQKANSRVATINFPHMSPARTIELLPHEIRIIPLPEGRSTQIEIKPAKGIDAGHGPGKSINTEVEGGHLGIILDARGRPVDFGDDEDIRRARTGEWRDAFSGGGHES